MGISRLLKSQAIRHFLGSGTSHKTAITSYAWYDCPSFLMLLYARASLRTGGWVCTIGGRHSPGLNNEALICVGACACVLNMCHGIGSRMDSRAPFVAPNGRLHIAK